jgi:C1A family cysteine protease
MKEAASKGVFGGAVYCNMSIWASFKSGIMTWDQCEATPSGAINHAVEYVGWGTTSSGVNYWIIKNSWGPLWGENGFMKLEMTDPTTTAKKAGACKSHVYIAYSTDTVRAT